MIGESRTINSLESVGQMVLRLHRKNEHDENSPQIMKILVLCGACSFSSDNGCVSDRKKTCKTPLFLEKNPTKPKQLLEENC